MDGRLRLLLVIIAFACLTPLTDALALPTRINSRRKKLITFNGEVQQSKSPEELLSLSARRKASPTDAVKLLARLSSLFPRNDASLSTAIVADARLHRCLRAIDVSKLSPDELASLVHSSAMIRRPLRRSEVPQDELAAALNEAADGGMDPHAAAQATWAWECLDTSATPAPERLLRCAAPLPFRVHLAAIDPSLLSLDKLLAEALPRRETIQSGSAAPSRTAIVEKRGTAWQSAVGRPFVYSGKVMVPRVGDEERAGLSEGISKVRDALAAEPIERSYDSVLLNYYEGGTSAMNFHSDPGQGPPPVGEDGSGGASGAAASGWGYSTCVVSSGATRLFTFRRIGNPNLRCTFALRTGDVVEMFGECQEMYQHAVKVEASEEAAGPRVSLVFKRTLEAERERGARERPDGRGW